MAKSKAGDLYIASVIHVLRDGKNAEGKPAKVTETIQPGQMVSDTDLTDAEVKDLMRHRGVLRAPTVDEEQQMDSREERQAAADAVRESEDERVRLANEQEAERQRLDAEQRAGAEKERLRLKAEQAKERDRVNAAAAKKVATAGKK
jgi:hypothetical protein